MGLYLKPDYASKKFGFDSVQIFLLNLMNVLLPQCESMDHSPNSKIM